MAQSNPLVLPESSDTHAMKQRSIFFVGAATTVIRYGGFTLLTDPNFLHAGDHAHLGYGLTSEHKTNRRLRSMSCRRSTYACCRYAWRPLGSGGGGEAT